MQVIARERGGGKTTQMIATLRRTSGAVMVVHSHIERQRIIGMFPDLKGRIFTFDDFAQRSRGIVHPDTPIFLDNADLFLQRTFGNVQLFSYSPTRLP